MEIPKYIDTIPKSDKLYRVIWSITSLFLFKPFSLPFFNGWRIFLLKLFGAKIGKNSVIHASIYLPSPKNLILGSYSALGPQVKFHFGRTIIGNKVTISQRTYLCSATHETSSINTPFVSGIIIIKDYVWVAAEAFIMSNVTIGEGAIIGARAAVFKDVDDWIIVGGNPAKFIKKEQLMTSNDFFPVQTTPFDRKTKIKIYLWKLVNKTIFRVIPNQIKGPRIIFLRLFGANLADSVNINRKSNIELPWNLTMGHLSSLGENSWIYCLDKIEIGQKCCIGKDVYLITGSHSIESINFDMVTRPIIIQDGCWIATGSYVLAGVTLAKFSVIGAKSVVVKNTEEFDVVVGNPAKCIKKREFK